MILLVVLLVEYNFYYCTILSIWSDLFQSFFTSIMSGFCLKSRKSFLKSPIKFKPRSNSSHEANNNTTSNLINKFKPKKTSKGTDNELPNSIPEMIQTAIPEFSSKYSFCEPITFFWSYTNSIYRFKQV